MMKILNLLFRREEIDGGGICPVYLYRWTIFQPRWMKKFWRGFGIYIHKFVGDDWSLDLHDHPKRFISIGLRGSYLEETPTEAVIYRAPWIRTFPADHIHRISLMDHSKPCWTFVIVLRTVREWGFWHGGQFIKWREYVSAGNPIATNRRSCQ